jgi:cytochrome P450
MTWTRLKSPTHSTSLARLEGKIAISRLINHFPDLKLSDDNYEYMDTMVMRGVRNMSVELI